MSLKDTEEQIVIVIKLGEKTLDLLSNISQICSSKSRLIRTMKTETPEIPEFFVD